MKNIQVISGLKIIDVLGKMFDMVNKEKESAACYLSGIMVIMYVEKEKPMIEMPPPGTKIGHG